MESAIPQGQLGEIVRAARSRTGVPAVAAGLYVDGSVELAADGDCTPETPFRVASISKWFTASLVSACGALDDETRRWLSHTAGLRSEVAEPLPDVCQGLWSYANSGYWAAGDACAAAMGMPFADAMRGTILDPLGLSATSFEEPPGAAEGHLQDGVTGHRPAGHPNYPAARLVVWWALVDGPRPAPIRRAPVRRPVQPAGAAGERARRGVLPRLLAA